MRAACAFCVHRADRLVCLQTWGTVLGSLSLLVGSTSGTRPPEMVSFTGAFAGIYGGDTVMYGGDTALHRCDTALCEGDVVVYSSAGAVYGGDADIKGGRKSLRYARSDWLISKRGRLMCRL